MDNRLLSVLIVDDEKLIRDGMKKLLNWQEHGFQIIGEAGNGKEALRVIEHSVPDIVLTDLRMPAMDGLALAASLAQQKPAVQVVIITGYDEFEYAKQAVRSGVFDYLLKPVSRQELLSTMLRLKEKLSRSHVGYPFDEEEQLLHAVREHDVEQAFRALDTMFGAFRTANARQEEVCKICRKLLTELESTYRFVRGPKAVAVCPELAEDAPVGALEQALREYVSKIFRIGGVDSSDLLVEKLKRYLESHYQQNISLKMLEDEFYFNASYISRTFKSKTGENYSDYLLRLRIEHAKRLLRTSSYSIRQISEMTGFSSPKYFSKVFKDMEGIQPGTYRIKEQGHEQT